MHARAIVGHHNPGAIPALAAAARYLHAHPATVVNPTLPLPALAVTFVLATANAYVQVAAAWFTVNVWPPAVIVPLRARPAGFTSKV